MLDKIRIAPDADQLDLDAFDPRETFGWDKAASQEELPAALAKVSELQNRLFAEGTQALLVVLQAFDAAGKDGVIRSVLTGLNPAGVRVTSFKVPAGREAEQDYLWRVHAACPAQGEIAVFNRSHYEDVLVVRVKGFVPEERWRKRYAHIRHFEQLLSDEGTKVVKLEDTYRSYAAQVDVKARKPVLAAKPGTSNHGLGLATDLCGGIENFGTAQHQWMKAHAPLFGFYHPAWAQAGGSKPEPWHWEFAQ